MRYYVYEHFRPRQKTPFYVGKGTGKRGWSVHGRSAAHAEIIADLKNSGLAFDVRVVADGLTAHAAFVLEIERIAFWRSQGAKLVNITSGGAGSCCDVSEETRRKQKIAQRRRQDEGRGTKLSDEARAKISASLTGRKRPPEERAKIAATMKGRSPSAKHRANLSASQKGRQFTQEHRERATAALQSPEVRAKLSAAAKAREAAKAERGFTVSDETRARLAAAQKARWADGRGPLMSDETRAKISATKRAKREASICESAPPSSSP